MTNQSSTGKKIAFAGCIGVGGWVGLVLVFVIIWGVFFPDRPPTPLVPYSDFVTMVRADHDRELYVDSASFHGREIHFVVVDPMTKSKYRKSTFGPEKTDELLRELTDHHVVVKFEPGDDGIMMGSLKALAGFLALVVALIGSYAWSKISTLKKELDQARTEIKRLEDRSKKQSEPAFE